MWPGPGTAKLGEKRKKTGVEEKGGEKRENKKRELGGYIYQTKKTIAKWGTGWWHQILNEGVRFFVGPRISYGEFMGKVGKEQSRMGPGQNEKKCLVNKGTIIRGKNKQVRKTERLVNQNRYGKLGKPRRRVGKGMCKQEKGGLYSRKKPVEPK